MAVLEDLRRTPADVNPFARSNTLKLTDAQRERLKAQVMSEYLADQAQRQRWAQEMKEITAQWLSGRGPERKILPFPGASNVDIPFTRIITEGTHAALVSAFDQSPFMRWKDTIKLEQFTQWEHEKELEAKAVWNQLLLNALVPGTGIGRIFPYKGRLFDKENQDRLRFENVADVDDFFIPFRACGNDPIQEAHHIGLRTYPYVFELLAKRKSGLYENVSVDDGLPFPSASDSSGIAQAKENYQKQSKPMSSGKMQMVVHHLEWYTKFSMEEDDEDSLPIDVVVFMSISPRQVIYRVTRNPRNFRPYFRCVRKILPGQFWGIGIPKEMMQMQLQMNMTYNMRNDAVLLSMMPWGTYVPGFGYKPGEIRLAPGILIPVEDNKAIEWQRVPAPPEHAFRETGELWNVAEKDSGIGATVLGVGQDRTATGARLNMQQGGLRLDVTMKTIGYGVTDMVKILMRWNKILRGRQGVTLRVIGTQNLVEFTEDDFNCDMLPSFEINSLTGNRQVEREVFMLMVDRLMQIPGYIQDPQAVEKMLTRMAMLLGISSDQLIPASWQKGQQALALTTAAQENAMMFQGRYQEASVYDDHGPEAHLASMRAAPPETQSLFRLHIQHHEILGAHGRMAIPVPAARELSPEGGVGRPPGQAEQPSPGSANSIQNAFPKAIQRLGEVFPTRQKAVTV